MLVSITHRNCGMWLFAIVSALNASVVRYPHQWMSSSWCPSSRLEDLLVWEIWKGR